MSDPGGGEPSEDIEMPCLICGIPCPELVVVATGERLRVCADCFADDETAA